MRPAQRVAVSCPRAGWGNSRQPVVLPRSGHEHGCVMTGIEDVGGVAFDGPDALLEHETVAWAIGRVRAAGRPRRRLAVGLSVAGRDSRPDGFPEAPRSAESYRLRATADRVVVVSASDVRGLAYALTELAGRITAGEAPATVRPPS